MTQPIASRTRLQIRQRIGYNLGKIIVSTWSGNGTITTGIDAVALSRFADDELIGAHLQFNEAAHTEYGYKRWITAFAKSTGTVTFATIGTGEAPASTEAYELWLKHDIDHINSLIAGAEDEVAGQIFTDKEDHTTFTEEERYQYPIPTGFYFIDDVSYCASIGDSEQIDSCDAAWTGATGVTATLDTTLEKEGSGCAKLVVAAGAAAGIIAYHAITALDLTAKTEVEIWVYSITAFAAGAHKLVLSASAACATEEEAINIPATSAYTWTRHVLTLANPSSDAAIISVGIKMVTDTTYTLYLDDILGVNANTREWKPLKYGDFWDIAHGSTPYLKLTQEGLSLTGEEVALRLTGYQMFTAMSADTSTSQVDPSFIINRVSELLAEGSDVTRFHNNAEVAKTRNRTSFRPGTVRV